MRDNDIRNIILRRFDDASANDESSEIQINCPFCKGNKKLWINVSKRVCHCFKCEYSSGILFFLKKIGEQVEASVLQDPRYLSDNDDVDLVKHVNNALKGLITTAEKKPEKVELPTEFRYFSGCGEIGRIALDYLRTRGIYLSHTEKYKLGYCASGMYRNRVVIPCYMHGELVYYTGRAFYPKVNKKYLNPPISKIGVLYNYDNLAPNTRAVIVEGTFDCMKGGDGFIGLLGKSMSRKQRTALLAKNPKEIVIMLDPDALTDAMSLAKTLTSVCPVRVVTEHEKDAGSMEPQEVLSFVDKAKEPNILSEVSVVVRNPRR